MDSIDLANIEKLLEQLARDNSPLLPHLSELLVHTKRLENRMVFFENLVDARTPSDVGSAAVRAVEALLDRPSMLISTSPLSMTFENTENEKLASYSYARMDANTANALIGNPEVRQFLNQREMDGPSELLVHDGHCGYCAMHRLKTRIGNLGAIAVLGINENPVDEIGNEILKSIAEWVAAPLERTWLYQRLETAFADARKTQSRLVQTEKHSAIGRLAAGLAHEIGTPLNIISGRAEYLLSETAYLEPMILQGLKTIIQQIERITDLVQRLLDFSRETAPARDPTQLKTVVQVVLELLSAVFARADIDAKADIPAELPDIVANSNQMQQVFINLLMNSVDAIATDPEHLKSKGRGRITIEALNCPEDQKISIRIFDNGTGIRKEHISHVFDPFFSTKPIGTGTGLGLAVVYGIILETGGTVEVESDVGSNTIFTITLPSCTRN